MEKRKLLIIVLLFFFVKLQIFAQAPEFKEIRDSADYPFILYLPSKDICPGPLPVIVFLHGRSLSGTDLSLVKRYGVIDAIERGRKIPAIVIAPQVNRPHSWEPDKVLTVLNYVQKNYKTDLSRVYVVGMSLGGYGTFHFAGKYPERVAAAVALCGGGNVNDACNIAKTNIWIQHGQKDVAVLSSESVKMYDAIKACNPVGKCELTLYPNLGHSELAREFTKDTLYNWIFQFKLSDTLASKIVFNDTISSVKKPEKEISHNTGKIEKDNKTDKKAAYHTIRKGDTLYALALKYGTTVKKLCALNGLQENTILNIGQKIKLR
ncbi:MAG: hypothetical protein A2W91_04570 [Bacteroidetes bacterium GWF2_38_335]|nr:MAG: hypothetical protein A2W91_04570 [Bacteroidetes bacterium GWF2_38_335]HBS88218.1 phospholipase [Bacteroidales bacterium]